LNPLIDPCGTGTPTAEKLSLRIDDDTCRGRGVVTWVLHDLQLLQFPLQRVICFVDTVVDIPRRLEPLEMTPATHTMEMVEPQGT
jgi:hypothetical protein